jgi:hypothetical protein
MVRIVLFDNQHNRQGFVEFDDLPIVGQDEYRCMPDGLLARESAAAIARALREGAIGGWIERHYWYRQAKEAGKERQPD